MDSYLPIAHDQKYDNIFEIWIISNSACDNNTEQYLAAERQSMSCSSMVVAKFNVTECNPYQFSRETYGNVREGCDSVISEALL